MEPPPVAMVLRYPVELWVSCGEGFVKPESELNREHVIRLPSKLYRSIIIVILLL